jgi:hypothetical protein
MAWSVVAIVCLAWGQTAATALSPDEFAALAKQLGSPVFAEREAASQRLWLAADSVQAELAEIVKNSRDPEVRYRAALILERFRQGIYADTPRGSVAAIQMFNRDRKLRTEALRRLRDAGDWTTIRRLLNQPLVERRLELVDDVGIELPNLISNRLTNDDLATAEQLLALAALRSQRELRRLALLRAARGTLADHIAAVLKLEEPTDLDRRDLAISYEAAGEFASARKLAQQLEDVAWERRLAERAGDWALAARLGQEQNEAAGLIASLWRLAGHEAAYRAQIQRIVAEGSERAQVWPAAQTLFMLGETDEALALLQDFSPQLGFHILIARQDYAAAFALANTPRSATFDRAWLRGLPLGANHSYTALTKQFRLASSVAVALHDLGETESSHQIGDLLLELAHEQLTNSTGAPADAPFAPLPLPEDEADPLGYRGGARDPFIDEDPANPFGPPPPRAAPPRPQAEAYSTDLRNQMRMALQLLRRIGRQDEALRQAAWLIDRQWDPLDVLPFALDDFPSGIGLAELWEVAAHQSELSTHQQVQTIARWLAQHGDDAAWRTMLAAEEARGFATPVESEGRSPLRMRTAAELCLWRGDEAWGLRLLESDADDQASRWRAAKLHFAAGRFNQARKICESLRENSADDGSFRYVVGLLQEQGGDLERGQASRVIGMLVASLSDPTSAELINTLMELKLPVQACEVAEQFERTSIGFELHYHLNTGNALALHQPLTASRHYEAIRRALLSNGSVVVTEDAEYVTFAYTTTRVRARGLLATGRLDEAWREILAMRRILPREVHGLEQFIPQLTAAGRTEEVDAWWATVIASQEQILAAWPRAAAHHNALAWTCARCARDLDRALKHAVAATQLQPENAEYADTLAEVHFARGDIAAATSAARRAVKLAPQSPLLAVRLKQFEAISRGEKVQRSTPPYMDRI